MLVIWKTCVPVGEAYREQEQGDESTEDSTSGGDRAKGRGRGVQP